jgi:hypothetical protein
MADDFGLFDTDTTAPNPCAGAGEDGKPEKAPELVYGTAEEFLHEQLLPTYVRSVTGKTAKWCIEWYFHPEAVSRVAALWRSWEHLRLDPATGMSVWWRDHADHHMGVLLNPQGQFYNCDMKEHRDPTTSNPRKHPGSAMKESYLERRRKGDRQMAVPPFVFSKLLGQCPNGGLGIRASNINHQLG